MADLIPNLVPTQLQENRPKKPAQCSRQAKAEYDRIGPGF